MRLKATALDTSVAASLAGRQRVFRNDWITPFSTPKETLERFHVALGESLESLRADAVSLFHRLLRPR